MTVKDLIRELLDVDDLGKEVKIYSLIDMEYINIEDSEYEFIGYDIKVYDDSACVYIEGNV